MQHRVEDDSIVSNSSPRERRDRPTRVGQACQRCRRVKARCDRERPCVPCLRAQAECVPAVAPPRGAKRQRLQTGNESPRSAQNDTAQNVAAFADAQNLLDGLDDSSGTTAASAFSTQDARSARTSPSSVRNSSSSALDFGEGESAMGLTRKLLSITSHTFSERRTSAIPDGTAERPSTTEESLGQRKPVATVLGIALPSAETIAELLQEYFDRVHWFSLIVFEPVFRQQFNAVQDGLASDSQKDFLLLLATVLGVGAWYKSKRWIEDGLTGPKKWTEWQAKLLKHTETHLFELMDRTSLASVQTCTLLGSYLSYHGKPNSSFALLGATIKTAQALGLHREPKGSFNECEQRKRVWWTIYTWDRFASITFGRPLGINDKDCNVTMPSDIMEDSSFWPLSGDAPRAIICYSPYQRALNMLYLIASPVIEAIFGLRSTPSNPNDETYSALVTRTNRELKNWRESLPQHLHIDFNEDLTSSASTEAMVYSQQALALQLTLSNIIIVLHRPLLARQVEWLSQTNAQNTHNHPPRSAQTYVSPWQPPEEYTPTEFGIPSPSPSSEYWWAAATETSRITELPQLAQLASDGHLVAFMAINLFNSAIVLVILALSDPLSDRAQLAKRYITRIYRLQRALGERSTLSLQSSVVLQDVIRILLRREQELMLSRIEPSTSELMSYGALASTSQGSLSVQDTLRLPVDTILQSSGSHFDTNDSQGNSSRPTPSSTTRLHESLASVQQAFQPIRSSETQNNREQRFTAEDLAGTGFPYEGDPLQRPALDSNWLGEEFQTGEDGMFWIWDTGSL